MKRTTDNYRISMPNMVRFAIDHIRRRNPTARDADLLGFIMHAGVQHLLKDSPEIIGNDDGKADPAPGSHVIAFPISAELNEQLQELFDRYPGKQEQIEARLIELGLSVFEGDEPERGSGRR